MHPRRDARVGLQIRPSYSGPLESARAVQRAAPVQHTRGQFQRRPRPNRNVPIERHRPAANAATPGAGNAHPPVERVSPARKLHLRRRRVGEDAAAAAARVQGHRPDPHVEQAVVVEGKIAQVGAAAR